MNNQFEEKNALMENLIACTNSDNYKIRAAAYTALGNFVDIDEVLYKMKDGLVDSNPEVREASVKSLRKIYNERKEKEWGSWMDFDRDQCYIFISHVGPAINLCTCNCIWRGHRSICGSCNR